MPVATGIIMTVQGVLWIHMLMKKVVPQMPSSSSGGFTGSPQNSDVICASERTAQC
jgi:hypothetical protein